MPPTPSAPETMTLDRSDGSATNDLYRAVLGSARSDYYLTTFTRFDSAGKSSPSWNWAAALLSLNWMLFRKLWTVALAYVGALMAATLLLLGIGRIVFQLPIESQWLLLAFGVLLAVVLPGTYGNAWLYADCNRKMERALAVSSTLDEACSLLARQSSGVKRIVSLAGLNVALCLIVAAMAQSVLGPNPMPLSTGPVTQSNVAGPVQSGLAKQTLSPPASAPSLAASAPLLAVSAVTPSQGADLTGNLGMVQEGAAAAASLALPSPVVATIAPDPLPAPPSAGTVAAKRTHEKQKAKLAPERKSDKGVQSNNTSKTAKLTKAERRAMLKADKAAKAATKAAEKSLADNGAETNSAQDSRKFLINIGLFADDNNARNAIVKLQDVGFPVLSQEVKSSKGVRTRVRVGPFETQPEAERAAERIRGLQLDAAVFKQ